MKPKKPISPENAQAHLEDLCARSEQCTFDLRQKLLRWGIRTSDSDHIIDALIDARFVDDARFARAYVIDKFRFNAWGRHKIRTGLYAKRIAPEIIAGAMETIAPDVYTKHLHDLTKALIKSLSKNCSDRREVRDKALRRLAGRGFEPTLIIDTLEDASVWD